MSTNTNDEFKSQTSSILRPGTIYYFENKALISNIQAALSVVNIIKSTYGPKGRDKLIYRDGKLTVTNDGATILKLLKIEHPAAQILVNTSLAQDREAGDGTTGVVILTGALLTRGFELIQSKIHPTIVVKGFKDALYFCLNALKSLEQTVNIEDEENLKKIASTSLNSKIVALNKEHFSDLLVKLFKNHKPGTVEDLHMITIKQGRTIDSEIVEGVCFKRPFIYAGHNLQPKIINEPKVLLLDMELEYKHQGEHTKIAVTSSEELKEFVKVEWEMFEAQLNKIEKTGCNVILNRKAVGDFATQFFAKKNIASIGRIDAKTMQLLSKAMNVRVISSIEHLSADDERTKLGKCVLYEEKKIREEYYSVINTKNSPVVTIILHGASNMLVEEVERSFIDAFSAIKRLNSHHSIVLGGGATEMQLRQQLKQAANNESKDIKRVYEAFGDALSEIPAAICDNAGLDTANLMIELEKIHASDDINSLKYGVGVNDKRPMDMHELHVWEPSAIKKTALQAAVEASTLILSINGVIALPKEESLADKNVRIAEQNQARQHASRRKF